MIDDDADEDEQWSEKSSSPVQQMLVSTTQGKSGTHHKFVNQRITSTERETLGLLKNVNNLSDTGGGKYTDDFRSCADLRKDSGGVVSQVMPYRDSESPQEA